MNEMNDDEKSAFVSRWQQWSWRWISQPLDDDEYADSDLTIVELVCAGVFVAVLAVVIALTALGISIWGLVHD